MDNSTKIHHVSTALVYTSYLVIASIAVFIYATLFNVYTGRDALGDYLNDQYIPTLIRLGEADLLVSIPAAIIFFIPFVVWMYALWRLTRLFKLFRSEIYFSRQGADHLLIFALLACLMHVFELPILGIADYVLTLGTDLAPYGIPLPIHGDEIFDFVLYAAFLTISWIFREATKIARENEEFV